jgi:serine-type D-Ala-D-Ala carboxypeptidase (penicillin-binding protein 5/6)
MRGFPLRVFAAVLLTAGLVGAPVVALARHPTTPAAAAVAAVPRLRTMVNSASSRLNPDNLRRRPEPTPSPTPSATPTPAPAPPSTGVAVAKPRPGALALPTVTAQTGVLLDADTGRILWSRNSRAAHPMASIAKIFTVMVAVNLMPLDRQLTVPASITSLPWDSTMMGLTPGEILSVRDLLDGALIVSGNDAAVTLAQGVTSQTAFVANMNALAGTIGLHGTHFANPVGLDDPGQYSTAMDLATAAIYLDRNYPLLARIAATGEIDIPAAATHKAHRLQNFDKLLWTYPGVNGLKGGYTGLAGGCVLTTATLNGHHVVAVVLGSPPLPSQGAFADMKALLDYGAALYRP